MAELKKAEESIAVESLRHGRGKINSITSETPGEDQYHLYLVVARQQELGSLATMICLAQTPTPASLP
jgi:hypothetical protein